jgi:tetratricopeptide (TPR) repeat protein
MPQAGVPSRNRTVRRAGGLSRRAIAWALVATVVLGGAVLGVTRFLHSRAAAQLPVPPTTTSQSSAVRSHLAERYAAALAQPTSPTVVADLCTAYHADMFFDEADRCYAVVEDLEPDEWRWRYRRAVILSERGGGEALATTLRRVVTEAPEFAPAWLRLGDAEFKAGRYEAARKAWQKASELPAPESSTASPRHVADVPASAYAALGLARIAIVNGDSQRARATLEGVAAEAPQFGPALRLLGDVHRSVGLQADADRLLYRANRLPPYTAFADPVVDDLARESRNSVLLLRLASEANLATNAGWSEYLTRRALEFDPDNPEVISKMGRLLRTIGRNEEALGFFQRYHQMVPGDYLGLAHIGSCLSALGRYDEAESFLRRALVGNDDPVTHYNLGLLLSVTNRVPEAIAEYEKALAQDPAHGDARTNMAAALVRDGKLDRAVRELEAVVVRDPDNALARTNLGLVFLQLGRRDQARVQLQEALRIDPRLVPAEQALDSIRE